MFGHSYLKREKYATFFMSDFFVVAFSSFLCVSATAVPLSKAAAVESLFDVSSFALFVTLGVSIVLYGGTIVCILECK